MSCGRNYMGEGHHHGQDTGRGLIHLSTVQLMCQSCTLYALHTWKVSQMLTNVFTELVHSTAEPSSVPMSHLNFGGNFGSQKKKKNLFFLQNPSKLHTVNNTSVTSCWKITHLDFPHLRDSTYNTQSH